MLKLYNKEHVAVGALTNLKDYKIEYLLSGEDLIEFSLSISDENIHLVEEEGYIRNKFNEYVIKAIDPSQNFKRFTCIVNVESIKAKAIKNFDTSNNTIDEAIRLAIAGTGWILIDTGIAKRRTVRVKNTDALEVLREIRKVFRVDFRFDTINKKIFVYEQLGSDKGVYFSDELNLKSLQIPSDTYDYATRLYCYGKEGLNISSITGGKEYVENYQYSNKIIEKIWTDDRYTVVENLKEDAIAKIEELSKPKRSYQAGIADLAKMSDEYEFLDFFLGDTITLLSKTEKFRDKQRIVKYIEYPNNPSENTCELGNTTLTFEELQKENEAKNQVVNNITTDNGTVDGSTIDSIKTEQISDFETSMLKVVDFTAINADIQNLKAQNVTITGKLTAIEGEFGTLTVNVATIDKLTVTHSASINDLQANKASITQLQAVNATIQVLEAQTAKIETLLNGNLSSENIQAGGITSDKLTIANGFIKNAMIDSLDVSKVNAGDISTNKFKIKSDDGGIEIVGATQQFKDKNNKVRIQMGKDTQGNFNFIIRGEDGTSTLIDHTGVKEKAIADDLIKSNMISSNAVGEKQIDYNSFSKGFNKDTNTTTLKATKIKLDNQNQTLDIAFNQLKTQSDETKSLTESHSTAIGVIQGQISTAINNTQIVKDGQTILLKDDYNRTVATVDSMKSTIGSHTTQINSATGKINSVETKVNTVERNLNSITARVSSTETNITTIRDTANNANNKIDNLQVGGRNLAIGTKSEYISYSRFTGENDCFTLYRTYLDTLKVGDTITISLTYKWENIVPFDGEITQARIQGSGNVTSWNSGSFPSEIIKRDFKGSGEIEFSYKYVVTADAKKNAYWSPNIRHDNIKSGTVYCKNFKVEKGNKKTDWSPAPADTEKAINDIDIKIGTTNNKVAEIVTNLNGITQRVSNTETNIITIKNTADSANNKIDNLQIGGTNLISDYRDVFRNTGAMPTYDKSTHTWTITATNGEGSSWGAGLRIGGKNVLIPYGKTFIVSFEIQVPIACNWNVDVNNYPIEGSNWAGNDNDSVDLRRNSSKQLEPNKWIKCWFSYTNKNTQNTSFKDLYDQSNFGVINTTGSNLTYKIRNIKGELGNKPTDWSPCPYDLQIEITKTNNKVASIETNLSSITSRVSSVETTNANINGQISNLSARMNTAEQKITDSSIINIVKTSKTNGKNTFVQGTELEQTVSEFNYKFQNVSTINEVDNSNFGNGTQRWQLAKSDNNVPAIIEYSLNYNGGDIACTNSAYIGDCSFDKSVNWVQKIYPKNNRMTQFTLSGCYHYTNVRHGGGVSGPMAHLYMEIYNKDGTVEYYNHANFLDSGVTNVGWKTVHQTYTRSNKAIDYIKLFVYKRNTVGELRITQIDFHEGSIHRKWIPGGNEISNNITTVDANGVKVNSVHTKQFARMDEQFFCVYNNGEAPVNRQAFMGLENGVPTLTLGAHGINPGVQTFGGTHASFKHYAPDKSPLDWGGSWGMLEYKLDSGTNHISRLGFSQAGNIELIPHSATHLYKNVHVHGNPNAGQAWEISASMGFFPTYIKDWSTNAPLRGIKVHSHVIGSDNDNNIYCVSKSGEFSRLHAQIVNMQSARAAYSANISLARVFRDEAQVPVNLGESVEGLALAQKITLERQEEQEEAIICNLLASVEMYEMILETNPGIVNNEKRKSRIAAIYALLIKKDKLNNEDVPKCIIECVRKKLKESF